MLRLDVCCFLWPGNLFYSTTADSYASFNFLINIAIVINIESYMQVHLIAVQTKNLMVVFTAKLRSLSRRKMERDYMHYVGIIVSTG